MLEEVNKSSGPKYYTYHRRLGYTIKDYMTLKLGLNTIDSLEP